MRVSAFAEQAPPSGICPSPYNHACSQSTSRRRSSPPMVFLLRSLGRLPLTTLYGFARIIYFVTFYVLRWRRDLAARNLARSFPEKSPAERAVILKQSYRNMSEVFVELLWGWRASAEDLKARMVIDNPELVTRYVAERRSS